MNNGQCSPTATTTFNVTGPTGGTMNSVALNQLYIANLSACSTRSGGPYLIYAQNATGTACAVSGTAGITFNSATGYSNSSGGNFQIGQLISHDTLTGGGQTYGPGVDPPLPYGGTGTLPANDIPNIYLAPTYTTLTRSFEATMFLMWQSTTQPSIPVPLGCQTWQFSATASCSANCGSASSWSVTSSSAGLEGSFQTSSPSQTSVGQNTLVLGYPTWNSASH